jgi:uncharacterized SAM-binding protein YcdF (DUF218 family)
MAEKLRTEFPSHWSEERRFRHRLIQDELRKSFSGEIEIPNDTDGVVVLSAPEFVLKHDGTVDPEHPHNVENEDRIRLAIEIAKTVEGKRDGWNLAAALRRRLRKRRGAFKDGEDVALILNGTPAQLPHMRAIAVELGWPANRLEFIDCGPTGVANTKTQFEAMEKYYQERHPKHLTFVTTDYHGPRVERTGNANLEEGRNFSVVVAPFSKGYRDSRPQEGNSDDRSSVFRKGLGEARRIVKYSENGDISRERHRERPESRLE